jgi:hypothetical protein
MRRAAVIKGFKNSQKIRAIVDGVGLYMTIGDIVDSFVYTTQYCAVEQTLHMMAREKCGGISQRLGIYDYKMNKVTVDVQVDLV